MPADRSLADAVERVEASPLTTIQIDGELHAVPARVGEEIRRLRRVEADLPPAAEGVVKRVARVEDLMHSGANLQFALVDRYMPLDGPDREDAFAADLRTLLAVALAGQALAAAAGPIERACMEIPADQAQDKIVAHVPAGPHAEPFKRLGGYLTAGNFRALASALTAFRTVGGE